MAASTATAVCGAVDAAAFFSVSIAMYQPDLRDSGAELRQIRLAPQGVISEFAGCASGHGHYGGRRRRELYEPANRAGRWLVQR
jgi:hypothetical protein